MSKGKPEANFPSLSEMADSETGEYCELTLLGNIVNFRVAQVIDASPWQLELTPDELQDKTGEFAAEWQHVRAMVEAAYRLGLQDGLIKLGELA